ncbi:MAG: hypothetical protein OT477_10135 [Chloroflexi bacterium]|nr:hypothetical protein [Chloroflexota bacterium]
MSNYDSNHYQRKRAQDNLKLAQLQKEIADQEATIANARGFGARRKIQQAENNLTKLRPQVNTLIAQMQLEDAKIEAELFEQKEHARKALEQEKQRQLVKIKAKEQEERERLKAEKWASLTPDEQQAEINKRRQKRNLYIGGIVALIFMCFGCDILGEIVTRSQPIANLPANTPTPSPIIKASEESTPIPTLVPTQIPPSTLEPTALIPTLVPTQIPTSTPEPTATSTPIPPPTETPTPSPEELFNYTILRQWRPNQNPNSFSAEVLLEDDLSEEELISFVKYFDRDFELVNILVFTSMEAYDQFKNNTFDDEFKRGYLVYYIRNDSSGKNEILWMQQIGKFDHLYGETTKFSSP